MKAGFVSTHPHSRRLQNPSPTLSNPTRLPFQKKKKLISLSLEKQIYVVVRLGRRRLLQSMLLHGLVQMRQAINVLIDDHGPIQLPADQEPCIVTVHQDFFRDIRIVMASNLVQHQHLTYLIMSNAVTGLIEILIHRHNYREAHFNIFRTGGVRIGSGTISLI